MKKVILLILILLTSCRNDKESKTLSVTDSTPKATNHAEGFMLQSFKDMMLLTIKKPWPNSEKTYRYALVDRNKAASITLNKNDFDGIILTPVERIVTTSTTHIPALELLNAEETLVGFPGCDYISSEKTRTRIDNGDIRELGKNEGVNTEVLLDLKPDVVIGFGVDGANKTFETISKANIPVIYNGDWVEQSALAKAEWIKFFGALYGKEKEADSIFNTIEADYMNAKSIAAKATNSPSILSGAMHKDIWYLPHGSSPEAQFLKDANTNYLWKDTTGNGSLALSFESVFEKAIDAELWLSPSYYTSYEDLSKASDLYSQFKAFKNKNIYTFSNTTGKTGGVLYYELGTARPDLVLKDLIKICHPDLLPEYTPFFFKPLK